MKLLTEPILMFDYDNDLNVYICPEGNQLKQCSQNDDEMNKSKIFYTYSCLLPLNSFNSYITTYYEIIQDVICIFLIRLNFLNFVILVTY